MIYWFNEARNVEGYRAEKAARERAEQDKKDRKDMRYNRYNNYKHNDGSKYTDEEMKEVTKQHDKYGAYVSTIPRQYDDEKIDNDNRVLKKTASGYRNARTITYKGDDGTYRFPDREDEKREKNAKKFAKRNDAKDDLEVRDAVNRNMRRHPERWNGSKPVKPKSESTIFDDVEII